MADGLLGRLVRGHQVVGMLQEHSHASVQTLRPAVVELDAAERQLQVRQTAASVHTTMDGLVSVYFTVGGGSWP